MPTDDTRILDANAPIPDGCLCDQSFHDAFDMLGFRHFWCVTCDREICGGSPVNHKAMGHEVRRIPDDE